MTWALLAVGAVAFTNIGALSWLYAREAKNCARETLRRGEAELASCRLEIRLEKVGDELRVARAQIVRHELVLGRYRREIERLEAVAASTGDLDSISRGFRRLLSEDEDSKEAGEGSDTGPVPDWAASTSTE